MLESLTTYFDTIPSSHRALILAGGIAFFWVIEGIIPLVNFHYTKWKHAKINLLFTITTVIINFAFAFALVKASDWAVENQFGVLYWFPMPLWLFALVGMLLLDLVGAYLIHLIEHKIKVLWKFHMIHHADTMVDTTTANRHHPGESVFRAIFAILGIFVCGAPMWLVMAYQSASALLSQFNHANIKLPTWLDRSISWFIVSPNMHKIHHHFERPQTDTNYGNIFSIWDRIFGTYHDMPADKIQYGLDVLPLNNDSDLKFQIGIPFNKSIKTD